MEKVKFALPNIFGQDAVGLADFARANGFAAIDWSLDLDLSLGNFLRKIESLGDFEVRYHCRFPKLDLAYSDIRSEYAMAILKRMAEMVSQAGGEHMTIHIGLGLDDDRDLDWGTALANLAELVSFGARRGVTICLENLTTVWTSDPEKFAEMIRESGAGVTFDIGHAHACRANGLIDGSYGRYIALQGDKVFNAHIYHTETKACGHIAPKEIGEIAERLDVLKSAKSCEWWVIELAEPIEILKTRDMLEEYISQNGIRGQGSGDGYIEEALDLSAR